MLPPVGAPRKYGKFVFLVGLKSFFLDVGLTLALPVGRPRKGMSFFQGVVWIRRPPEWLSAGISSYFLLGQRAFPLIRSVPGELFS